MSASSRPPNRLTEFKSGGKIVRPRRTTTRPSPYDRPTPRLSPDSTPQNPNWLSRLILSPSRLIATGAGKVFSSVFGSESSGSSSSSDADEEDDDGVSGSTSEGELEDINEDGDDDNDSSKSGGKKNQTTEIVNCSNKDPPAVEWRNGTLRVIAQLLMQETFSREECDKLTCIIKSRVVDSPFAGGTTDGKPSEIPNKTFGDDVNMPDLRNSAVIEAKKWFEGKKLGSNSKSVEHGTCTSNTAPHAAEGEVGSPVDLAKSYMQARPPWASPSTNHIQLLSPSPMGKELFKEATPFSVSGNSLSPSKLNRDSPVTGSWNIEEELSKVRSRATEEMLRTRPSSKIDWSALTSAYRGPSLLGAGEVGGGKDKLSNFSQLIDVPLKWGSAATTSGVTDSQMAQDRLQNETLPPNATTSVPEKCQDLESTPTIEGRAGLQDGVEGRSSHEQQQQPSEEVIVKQSADSYITAAATAHALLMDTEETSHPLSSGVERAIQDALPLEVNYSACEEVAGRGDAVTANGFPSSASSLPAVHEREQKSMPSGEEHNLLGPDHNNMARSAPGEETCELLSEASMEVPNVNETDSVATDSQDSSSMYQEGLVQAVARPKRGLGSRTTGVSEKQQGRIVSSRYNKRGRGRGKQS